MDYGEEIERIRISLKPIPAAEFNRFVAKRPGIGNDDQAIFSCIATIKSLAGPKPPCDHKDHLKEMQKRWLLFAHKYDLTKTETQIFLFALEGLSTKEIAVASYTSTHTVKRHFSSIFKKAGVEDRKTLIARAWKDDFV